MVHVSATITVKPGQRAAFIEAFKKLVPLVLAEDGCIAYGPTVDIPTGLAPQPPVRDNVVTVVETWQSLDQLKAHLAAPHMQDFRTTSGHLIDSISLTATQPV
jgi:quinol monooxygenase YgiN